MYFFFNYIKNSLNETQI